MLGIASLKVGRREFIHLNHANCRTATKELGFVANGEGKQIAQLFVA